MSGYEFQELQQTAYGELSVSELSPQIQLQFPYNINAAQAIAFPGNGGTVVGANQTATCTTGTASDGFGLLLSRDVLKYSAGQGGLARFSTVYTAGVANSEQIHGIGNGLNGFFFGYNGADFGVLRREGGMTEIRELTVTTGSTTAEDLTITLDGIAVTNVSVTNTGDVTKTALEIANHNFSGVGNGWGAIPRGDKVTFVGVDDASHPGTYSLSGATTAVGTFAQIVVGANANDVWVSQTSWNMDKMDGNGPSGINLDQTKGNVYEIKYQWLGFGPITFSIVNPATGSITPVHRIEFGNSSTTPSVCNPTFPLFMSCLNKGNTSNVIMKTSSMAAFIEGREGQLGPVFATDKVGAIATGTNERPLLTIRNKQVYQSTINQVRIAPVFISVLSDLNNINATVTVRVYLDALPLTSTSYSDVNSNSSVVEVDSSSTDFDTSEAQFRASFLLTSRDSRVIDVEKILKKASPRQTIMITIEPSNSSTSNIVGATISWRELF